MLVSAIPIKSSAPTNICVINFHRLDTSREFPITKTIKPIIISMVMGGKKKRIKSIFLKNKKIFCYCISEYPLKFSKINWKIAEKYDGLSDHTMDITAPILFAILKKQKNAKNILIEKHVKLKDSKGPDASSSIEVSKLAEMITHIRRIENLKTI